MPPTRSTSPTAQRITRLKLANCLLQLPVGKWRKDRTDNSGLIGLTSRMEPNYVAQSLKPIRLICSTDCFLQTTDLMLRRSVAKYGVALGDVGRVH
jgi:hypothetical protein